MAIDLIGVNRRVLELIERADRLKGCLPGASPPLQAGRILAEDLSKWVRDFEDLYNDPALEIPGIKDRLRGLTPQQLSHLMECDAIFHRLLLELRSAHQNSKSA